MAIYVVKETAGKGNGVFAAGEELTHDYTANSVDQFAGQGTWVLECRCGEKTAVESYHHNLL